MTQFSEFPVSIPISLLNIYAYCPRRFCDDKRRTRVHKILKGFGTWTGYSLFECFLTKKERLQLHARLDKHLDAGDDRVRIYRICDSCIEKIETVGIAKPVEEKMYLI